MTHCMDPEQERAVWERVAAGRGRGQTPAAQPAPASEPEQPPQDGCQPPCRITPEQLLGWITDECEDAALYRHLAQHLPSRARRGLLEMAADEHHHARRLSAQYFVMTGQCPRVQPAFVPTACPLETLRRRYEEELAGSAAYRDAAACADGTLRVVLDELSRDEARHSRMVMCLLESVL